MGLENIGKMLLIGGAILVFSGLVALGLSKVGLVGRLPGDIFIRRDGFTFFFPVATSIILSLVITIVINVLFRLFRS